MRLANAEPFAAGILCSGGKGEYVRQFQRAWQKPGGENCLQPADGVAHGIETDGERDAKWRQWNQLQSGFRDDAKQTFRADEKAREIESGFVFMRAPTGADDCAIGENNFETENVIARDAVFQTTRAAGVGGDIAAEKIVRAAGRVGRIKEPAALAPFLKSRCDHGWLNDGDKIAHIDFQNAIHALGRKDNAAANGNAAADVAVTRATRRDGDFIFI